MARALIVSLLFVVASGCTSSFPPGSFDWGHGAAPLAEGQTRLQLGAGGGVGTGFVATASGVSGDVGIIGGGGGGLAVEHQLFPTLLVRGEGNMGCQSSVLTDNTAYGIPTAAFICPVAAYLGGQINPQANPNFALRLRMGGGADIFGIDGGGLLPSPYIATQGGVVLSQEIGDFEPYIEGHIGAKVGAILAPVATAGITGGAEYHLNDNMSFYGLVRSDVLFIAIFPSLSANLQAGALLTF